MGEVTTLPSAETRMRLDVVEEEIKELKRHQVILPTPPPKPSRREIGPATKALITGLVAAMFVGSSAWGFEHSNSAVAWASMFSAAVLVIRALTFIP